MWGSWGPASELLDTSVCLARLGEGKEIPGAELEGLKQQVQEGA